MYKTQQKVKGMRRPEVWHHHNLPTPQSWTLTKRKIDLFMASKFLWGKRDMSLIPIPLLSICLKVFMSVKLKFYKETQEYSETRWNQSNIILIWVCFYTNDITSFFSSSWSIKMDELFFRIGKKARKSEWLMKGMNKLWKICKRQDLEKIDGWVYDR